MSSFTDQVGAFVLMFVSKSKNVSEEILLTKSHFDKSTLMWSEKQHKIYTNVYFIIRS